MRGRWRSWRAPGSVSNVFVFFHYLLWKAKLNFDYLELKGSTRSHQCSIRSGFHCLLWRYENPSLHYTVVPMLLPSGNPFKCHEEVWSLQPMIPPKRSDIFPPDWEMLRRSRHVLLFLETTRSLVFEEKSERVSQDTVGSDLFQRKYERI